MKIMEKPDKHTKRNAIVKQNGRKTKHKSVETQNKTKIDIKKYCMSFNMNPYYRKVLEKVAFVIARNYNFLT